MYSSEDDNPFSRETIKKNIARERERRALLTPEQRLLEDQEREKNLERQRQFELQQQLELEREKLRILERFYQLENFIKRKKYKSIDNILNYFDDVDINFYEDFIKYLLNKRKGELLYILYKNGINLSEYSLTRDEIKTFNELTIYEEIKDYINKNDLESIDELLENLVKDNIFSPQTLRQFIRNYMDLFNYARRQRRIEIYNYLRTYLPQDTEVPILPIKRHIGPQAAGNITGIYSKYYNLFSKVNYV